MEFMKFCKNVLYKLNDLEGQIQANSKFTKKELSEILQNAKQENKCYLQSLSKINGLSAFDTSFLLSSVNLTPERIEIIGHAAKMYREEEFEGQGQTFSDFIFRVAANIEMLNMGNLELFKEIAKCKTDIYDFSKVLKNPVKYVKKSEHELQFAFQKVFY